MNDQCKGMDKVPPSQSSSSFYVNFCVITIKKKKKNFGIIAWYQSPTVEWFFLQTSPSFSKERILVSATNPIHLHSISGISSSDCEDTKEKGLSLFHRHRSNVISLRFRWL